MASKKRLPDYSKQRADLQTNTSSPRDDGPCAPKSSLSSRIVFRSNASSYDSSCGDSTSDDFWTNPPLSQEKRIEEETNEASTVCFKVRRSSISRTTTCNRNPANFEQPELSTLEVLQQSMRNLMTKLEKEEMETSRTDSTRSSTYDDYGSSSSDDLCSSLSVPFASSASTGTTSRSTEPSTTIMEVQDRRNFLAMMKSPHRQHSSQSPHRHPDYYQASSSKGNIYQANQNGSIRSILTPKKKTFTYTRSPSWSPIGRDVLTSGSRHNTSTSLNLKHLMMPDSGVSPTSTLMPRTIAMQDSSSSRRNLLPNYAPSSFRILPSSTNHYPLPSSPAATRRNLTLQSPSHSTSRGNLLLTTKILQKPQFHNASLSTLDSSNSSHHSFVTGSRIRRWNSMRNLMVINDPFHDDNGETIV